MSAGTIDCFRVGWGIGTLARLGYAALVFAAFSGLLLFAAAEFSLTVVDVADLEPTELARFSADLAFELERHLGQTVVVTPLADEYPVSDAPPGLWVRVFRGPSNIRVILEDRRRDVPSGREASADVEWPLSASRASIQSLLRQVLGPSTTGVAQAATLTVPSPEPAEVTGLLVLLGVGLAAGGVALGFAFASAGAKSGDGQAALQPEGATSEAATLTTVSLVSLGLAGASLLGSALWAMAE